MPVQFAPDVTGSLKPVTTAIDDMVTWALSQDGKGYSEEAGKRCGPDSYDCSGFVYSACVSANLRPPGGTTGGCGSSDTFTQWPDRSSNGNTAISKSGAFVKGDLIYFDNGTGGAQPGHVGIALDGKSMISALNTQYGVIQSPITWGGTPMGAIRLPGGITGGTGGTNTATPTGGGTNGNGKSDSNASSSDTVDLSNASGYLLQNVNDPRDNLPFSAAFMGQTGAGSTGSLALANSPVFRVGRGRSVMPNTTLVRGGITELNASDTGGGRPRGNFRCYFMMNPLTISYDANISTDIRPASQQSAALRNSATFLLQQQSITFTVVFNRMYEVWQGNVHNPHPEFGGPEGPSDIGCRWDIRALERLLGMYDATQDPKSKVSTTMGLGTMGAGPGPPQSLPVQVVFGGQNSLQFQGQIVQFDYTYTLFDVNMIPIEASADIGIMQIANPMNSSAPLVNAMIKQYGQSSSTTPIATTWGSSGAGATFNAGITRGQVPGLVPRGSSAGRSR